MQIINKFNRTYITLKDEYQRVPSFQAQVYAKSGEGKGILCKSIAETWQYLTKGIVIFLVDPKMECEGFFEALEPMEDFHLNRLKLDGMIPEKHNVILHHPFSFNLNKDAYLPEMDIYTIPIKNLSKDEFGILAETDFESDSVRIMLHASDNISKNEGIYAFLHEIERLVKGNKKKKQKEYDPNNFYLNKGVGTEKAISESSSYMHPFMIDYFLRKASCPYSIDWKKILSDNSCFHVFFSKWIAPKDDKIHGFLALSLLNQILHNLDYAKKPILIIIPEVLFLCPDYALGYQMYLAKAFEKALVTMRSKGKGMSSICDSQNWMKTSSKIKGSATITILGKLNPEDLDRMVKARGYTKKEREMIMNLGYNEFVVCDLENQGPFRFFLSRSANKEEKYNWIEMYRKYFPNKMKRYTEIIDYMKKELKEEENNIKNSIEKLKKSEEQEKLKEETELENKSVKSKKLENEIEKTKSKRNELEYTKKKLIVDYLENKSISDSEKSERKLSVKFGVGRFVVHKILFEFKNKETKSKEDIDNMMGEGVTDEEIDYNFTAEGR